MSDVALDRLSIKAPRCMAQHWHDDGETKETAAESQGRAHCDNHAQKATASGFGAGPRNEALSAGTRPTSRSSISGNETTLIASASTAKQEADQYAH